MIHWVPKCVLYRSKEEGGQGLVDLESRTAAFRLQFIQRFLYENYDVVWRPVASTILRGVAGLGLDASLFLADCGFISLCNLPSFYQGLFKAWTRFKWTRLEPAASLFWLLEEPLVWGGPAGSQGWQQTGTHGEADEGWSDHVAGNRGGCGSWFPEHRGSGLSAGPEVGPLHQNHPEPVD